MRDTGVLTGLTTPAMPDARPRGRVRAGTSGFAYPGWAPLFYPATTPAAGLLPHYAARLSACELSTTYYARPTPPRIDAWATAVPASFRFMVKAQRGTAVRALAADPVGSGARLAELLWTIETGFLGSRPDTQSVGHCMSVTWGTEVR